MMATLWQFGKQVVLGEQGKMQYNRTLTTHRSDKSLSTFAFIPC